MTSLEIKKQYGGIVFVVICLVLVNIAGFLFFWRPHLPPNTFGGRVSALSDHTIMIVDAHGDARTFAIASSTQITMGKNVAPETDLAVDTFVMLSAATGEPSAIATKIRILSTDSFVRPRKPVSP